jgi:hypothetical protein
MSRRCTTVCTTSTRPSRPWPANSVAPKPNARSASASSTPEWREMMRIVASPMASFSSIHMPDHVAGGEAGRIAEQVPCAVEMTDRVADGEDPDQHLEESDDRHDRALPAHGEQDAQRGERDVEDAQREDEQRAPRAGEELVDLFHPLLGGSRRSARAGESARSVEYAV